MADRTIQKPLKCRIAHCGAPCARIIVEQMECLHKDVTKCPFYERRDDLYENDFTEEVLNKIKAEIASCGINSGMFLALEIIDKYIGK